jgi:signal transduction histidine kinase
VRIAIEDAGPGIPAAERTRVFEPYRRLARDIEARHPGTGIGLAVVADLISLYAGDVHVEEGRAGGARFVVSLVAAPAPHTAPAAATREVPA